MTAVTYAFEGFELSPARRVLQRDGKELAITPRAFDLLVALVERAGQVVTKNELLDLVWPKVVVEENNLAVQLSTLRKLLGGKIIATVPGRGYCFTAKVEVRDAESGRAPAIPASSEALSVAVQPALPAVAKLVGRDADLKLLESLLETSRCVTLVGPSGVGKTSLARVAAARWNGRSVWVDLSALTHAGQVAGAIARALGVHLTDGEPEPQLLRALKGNAVLLVLDNAEHLVEACAQLATVLDATADVQLLVTSQLPLSLANETVQRLEPLVLADAATSAPENLGDGALALLVARIVAANHRFRVTPATLSLLCAICVQLDGLPLALEMAAARVPTIGVQRVHDALAQRFTLLTRTHRNVAPHHRTLHDALDWSYRLLPGPEQRLFRALGVFAGGFALDLAVALMTDASHEHDAEWDVIDGIATLADRSLVVVSSDDPPRYRLLETMRAFALEQLALAGEEHAARASHAAAMLGLFSSYVGASAATKAMCEAEMENARDAIAWLREHDLRAAALLTARAASVATFTVWRHEASNWLLALEPLMNQPAGHAQPAEVQAEWWTGLGRVLVIRGETRASVAARRALELWRPLQQPKQSLMAAVAWVRGISSAGPELEQACAELQALAAAVPDMSARERLIVHGALVKAALERGDLAAALDGRLAEIALAKEVGLPGAVDAAESNVVFVLIRLGRFAEAAERGRTLLARIDASAGTADTNLPWVLWGLIDSLVGLGQLDEARALAPRTWAAGQRFGTPVVLPPLVSLAAAQRRFKTAARLLGYARQAHESHGMGVSTDDEDVLQDVHARLAAELGKAETDAAVAEGRGLSDEAAATLVAAAESPPPQAGEG